MSKIFLALIFLFTALNAMSQNDLFEKKEFIRGTDTLRYRIMYPEGYDPAKKYPMILFLHGAGERGKDNEAQLKHGGSLFTNPENRKKFPAIVVAPQCPKIDFWARIGFRQGDSLGGFTFPSEQPIGKALNLVSMLVDSMVAGKNVNTQKVYVGGLSMGGMGTFELLWRKPKTFAAAFPICGGGDSQKVTEYASGFPVWVFHGDADKTVSVSNSRLMVGALKAAGARVKYTEYPGVAHNSWDNAFAEPGLLKWLFEQQKK
jgi:predicted peptidase